MKKCYIYTRVSTSIQVDGYSLDAQRDRLLKEAKHLDLQVVHEYSDEGKSGKNITGRPEFSQMLKDIEAQKDNIDTVLVFKLSRFGRNAADVLTSLQILEDFGVNLYCVDDRIDSSTESGKLMISVVSAVAEMERDNIKVQTMAGRIQKAKNGEWNGGFPPYGYTLVGGKLYIAEDEKELIETIFYQFTTTTKGLRAVANFLNENNYVKKVRQNGKYEAISTTFVKGVIDNPVYMGKIAFGRRKTEPKIGKRKEYHVVKQSEYDIYEGVHEGIVSEEVWYKAQAKRKETGKKRDKIFSLEHEHILSGILKCPVCGASMYGNVARKKRKDGTLYKDYFFYQCKHRKNVTGIHCDYKKHWRQDLVDGAVAEVITKLVQNEKFEQAIREKINTKLDTVELEKELENLSKALKQCIASKNRIAEQLDSIDFSTPSYERKCQDLESRLDLQYEKMEQIELQKKELRARIENIKSEKVSVENVYNYLKLFDKFYEKFTDREKKEFMQSFLDSVYIYEETQEDMRILKGMKFKFPVIIDDMNVDEIGLDNESTVETVVLLQK